MQYELTRTIVETVHKDEFFLVEADSLEEAKRKVNEFEVDPYDERIYHYGVVDVDDAKETD